MSNSNTARDSNDGDAENVAAQFRPALLVGCRAEEALARLAAIVEFSDDAILSKTLQGILTSWNPAAQRLLGYSCEEVLGRHVSLVVAPEHRALEADIRERIRQGEHVGHGEIACVTKAGERVAVGLTVSPIRDQQGQITGVSMIMRDITQGKRTEEALRRSETYFRSLADALPQIVWVAKPDGVLEYFNKRWYEFTGLAPGRSEVEDWKLILHPEEVEACLNSWRLAVENGSSFQMECRLRDYRSEQYRWHLSHALPLRDERNRIIRWLGTCTDIEDQKRAEMTLADAREQLERAVQTRTAELEAVCYSLSHDLRGPLRAIDGYLEILLKSSASGLSSVERGYIEKSISAAQRMHDLVQDVLAFSRLSGREIEVQAVDIDRLVREIVDEISEFQPPRATVRIEGTLPQVIGHEALLTQCITNLLGNAVKFVAPGVKPRVRVYSQTREGKVRIWVVDNGIGIEKEGRQHLFKLFHRLHRKSEYDGTGVGLAIVRKAVERMGGEVGVDSDVGKGSRFWLELNGAGKTPRTAG